MRGRSELGPLAESIRGGSRPSARPTRMSGHIVRPVLLGLGAVATIYAGFVAVTWLRYGQVDASAAPGSRSQIDQFMPVYEVREIHQTNVAAPSDVTFAVAQRLDLQRAPLVRAIFTVRTLPGLLRGERPVSFSEGLLAETRAMGWGTLSETPGREVIMGAATRPWESSPTFRALPPEEFAAFSEPGYAKIVWSLSVQPQGDGESVFLTETRVQTTDPESRERFRRYWAMLSPGILIIRLQALGLVKVQAESEIKAESITQRFGPRQVGHSGDD